MTDKPSGTTMDLPGVSVEDAAERAKHLSDVGGILATAYPDIPSEYLVGIDRGHLGDWLQEVHDAGWYVHIPPAGFHAVSISSWDESYWGEDDATHRVDVMILRAYIAWKGREGK